MFTSVFGIPRYLDLTESGVTSGFSLSTNVDGVTLDISSGTYRISRYDGTRALILEKDASAVRPGQDLGTFPDLNTVQPSWPALTAIDTVFFLVVAENGTIYQTALSPLTGQIVREYLTLGAVQIDNTVDRNVTVIFPFVNINAKDYEESNVRTPTFKDAASLNVYGNANTTFGRNAGGTFFSGINFYQNPMSPNVQEFPAQSTVTFFTSFADGLGGYTFLQGLTDFAPYVGTFDDGTPAAGPLPNGTVLNSKFIVHHMLFEATLGLTGFQIGTNTYNSVSDALEAINTGVETATIAPFLVGLKDHLYVIMKGNASDFSNPDEVTFIKPEGRFFNRV